MEVFPSASLSFLILELKARGLGFRGLLQKGDGQRKKNVWESPLNLTFLRGLADVDGSNLKP